jgi:hypothetical protein
MRFSRAVTSSCHCSRREHEPPLSRLAKQKLDDDGIGKPDGGKTLILSVEDKPERSQAEHQRGGQAGE